MNIELISELAHEINRAYCISQGDTSQVPWHEAPEWQQESAIKGTEFTLANPNTGPERSHNEWLAEKTATGWKYGPIKNAEKKEHPCYVPYDQLPKHEQAKDYLFKAAVLSAAGILAVSEKELAALRANAKADAKYAIELEDEIEEVKSELKIAEIRLEESLADLSAAEDEIGDLQLSIRLLQETVQEKTQLLNNIENLLYPDSDEDV